MGDSYIDGAGKSEGVRKDVKKKVVVNHEYTPPAIFLSNSTNEPRKFYCACCGKMYTSQKGNFLSGGKSFLWRGNNGYLPFCKTCCETIMESFISFYNGNEEHALKRVCSLFDWFYDPDASAMTLSQSRTARGRVSLYPSKMSTRQVASRGSTYLDTIKDEYIESVMEEETKKNGETPNNEDEEEEYIVTKDMIKAWGKGFKPYEYCYLEEQYSDWIAKNECNTKTQEELFRNISLAQLDIRRARENGAKVSEAQKALQDLMNSANILPRQTADNILAETESFGTLIRKYETTSPIPKPLESWTENDELRKYINVWFKGGLAKSLGIKDNTNATLYEEAINELEKYTVHPRKISESESSDASIFDNVAVDDGGDGGDE